MEQDMNIPKTQQKRVVIVGAGFAGIELAHRLSHEDFQVVLIDRNNYHTFQPFLYQVAMMGLEPQSVSYPLRQLYRGHPNCVVRIASVTSVDPARSVIQTDQGEVFFDHLVLATGSASEFFGLEGVRRNSLTLKSIPEAMVLRNRILENFERAVSEPDARTRESLMNFVIVGGGPTGVELTGSLDELRRFVLPRDYPCLDFRDMKIYLVEMKDRLLSGMSEKSSAGAKEYFERRGINLCLGTRLDDYDGQVLTLCGGQKVPTRTVIWSAGVCGSVVPGLGGEVLTRGRRIQTDGFNRVRGFERIYALGDCACMIGEAGSGGHPMIAPVAIQQAVNLAANFKRRRQGLPMQPFCYHDRGMMAVLGRTAAVVDLGRVSFGGYFAWWVWLMVHLIALTAFRDKVATFLQWTWAYFRYKRGWRLIVKGGGPSS